MGRYVLGFHQIDPTQVVVVGGKGAHLGELSRIEGVPVPAGFCATTDAFQRILAEAPSIDDRLERLSRLKPGRRSARSIAVEAYRDGTLSREQVGRILRLSFSETEDLLKRRQASLAYTEKGWSMTEGTSTALGVDDGRLQPITAQLPGSDWPRARSSHAL